MYSIHVHNVHVIVNQVLFAECAIFPFVILHCCFGLEYFQSYPTMANLNMPIFLSGVRVGMKLWGVGSLGEEFAWDT